MVLVTAILFALAILLFIRQISLKLQKKYACGDGNEMGINEIPGMQPVNKREGNLPDIKTSGNMTQFLLNLHRQYGDIAKFWWEGTCVVSIASPELFRKQLRVFNRPTFMFKWFERLIGPLSLTLTNGDEGKLRRSVIEPFLSYSASCVHVPVYKQIVTDSVRELSNKEGIVRVPIVETTFRMVLKAVILSLFSDETYFKTIEEEKYFMAQFRKAYLVMKTNMTQPFKDYSSATSTTNVEPIDFIRRVMANLVDKRRRAPEEQRCTFKLIDRLLQYDDVNTVLDDAVTIFDGAVEPPATFVALCLYNLASNIDVQDRFYNEILTVLDGEEVTEQALPHFKYLKQILFETIRCASLAPWEAKYDERCITLGGYTIPSGTPIIHAFGVAHQNEDLWPNPLKFDPDRFGPQKKIERDAFVPFGFAAKRMCPGRQFGLVQTSVYLICICRKFKLKLADGQQQPKTHYILARHFVDEMWLQLEDRVKEV